MKNNKFCGFVSLLAVIALFVIMTGGGKGKETNQTTTEKAPEKKETKTQTSATSVNMTSGSADGTLSYDVVNNTGVTC